MPNPIGVNTSGINQDLTLGKSIANTGQGIQGKEKAVELAKATPGSELVYRDKQGDWQVAPVAEKGIMLKSNSPLHSADKHEIQFHKAELQAQGIEHPMISFVDEKPDPKTLAALASNPQSSAEILNSLPEQAADMLNDMASKMPIFNDPQHRAMAHGELGRMMSTSFKNEFTHVKELLDPLIQNPNTPPQALSKLLDLNQQYQQTVRDLNRNPRVLDSSQHGFGLPLNAERRDTILRHPNLSQHEIQSMLKLNDPHTTKVLAQNPSLPKEKIESLSVDLNPAVRLSLANNPATPEKILKEFTKDSHADVRKAAELRLKSGSK